ncbi:Hypothetical_protein [Hexamita inflata]|uniref:Hypothetical_protein n=1 Tax=Hexamita inflata TaxID=28002 RepID=A0AA86PF12_9EUKA|nr:Hypothetical protein HINF_LOCUS24581 [Hexamita inflata]
MQVQYGLQSSLSIRNPHFHTRDRELSQLITCASTHTLQNTIVRWQNIFLYFNNQSSDSIFLFNLLLQCLLILLIYQFLIHDPVIMAPHGASSDSNYPVDMTAAWLLI